MSELRARAAEGAQTLRQVDATTEAALRNPSAETIGAAVETAIASQRNDLPNLDASPIPAEMDVPVHVAWSRVMGDVQWIGKERATTGGARYQYRGIDDVKNHVSPILRRHGVIVLPTKVVPSFDVVQTGSNNSRMNFCRVTVTWGVVGPQGDTLPFTAETLGEAFDSGDKAATKAQSVAERIFYVVALSIPTNRPELDPEHGPQHELAAPKPPTADEYYARAIADGTSVLRLRQMHAELKQHPSIGETMIEEADGHRAKLIDIVYREGVAAKERDQQ